MIFLDFEFTQVVEPRVKLVCATTFNDETDELLEWWLHNDKASQEKLAAYLNQFKKNEVIFGYGATAEGRSFQSLNLDPVKFNWIDGFFEYRCLTNHNHALMYGKQLVDGQMKQTKAPPSKWERTEEDSRSGFKPTHSLAEATFKLTGEIRDTDHKNAMRDLIISDPEDFTAEERKAIQAYCTEDVIFLPRIYKEILAQFKKLLGRDFNEKVLQEEMLLRGKYAALTAKMESRGYPIDYRKTLNFSKSVGPLLEECQREINSLFPEIMPFRYNKAQRRFSLNQKAVRDWLHANVDTDRWMKTAGGASGNQDLSLSLDAFTGVFDFKHHYPKDNFGAQMVRFLKLKQNLNGFTPTTNKNKKSFWSAVGSDHRVRPYFNPYGSSTSRSQPGSTSFLFLKPAFMRSLCAPRPGKAIVSIDYGSEEFFISALVSGYVISGKAVEKCNMVKAYLSGDVYLFFAKLAGAVPMNGRKEDYKKERNIFKAVTLSISYQQTAKGLSKKLTEEIGEEFTEGQAQELINKFYEVYTEFGEWQTEIAQEYREERRMKLPCGYYCWGDSKNHRSSGNFPIQGFGASIMRKAVEFCEDAGLEVIVTLHDALYIEIDSRDLGAIDTFVDCMRRGFAHYFPDEIKDVASKIKMDVFVWGPDFQKDSTVTTPGGREVDCTDIYCDERAIEEFNQFSKFFEDREEDTIL